MNILNTLRQAEVNEDDRWVGSATSHPDMPLATALPLMRNALVLRLHLIEAREIQKLSDIDVVLRRWLLRIVACDPASALEDSQKASFLTDGLEQVGFTLDPDARAMADAVLAFKAKKFAAGPRT